MRSSIDETIEILKKLDLCKPLKEKCASWEWIIKWGARIYLGCSFLLLIIAVSLDLFPLVLPNGYAWLSWLSASNMALASVCSALLALVVSAIASIWLFFQRKKRAFDGFCNDIGHDLAAAGSLGACEPVVLKDAHLLLESKVRRISLRTARFFGGRTAAISVLAMAYPFVAPAFGADFQLDSFGKFTMLGIGLVLTVLSIDAIVQENVAARYQYQIEILKLKL